MTHYTFATLDTWHTTNMKHMIYYTHDTLNTVHTWHTTHKPHYTCDTLHMWHITHYTYGKLHMWHTIHLINYPPETLHTCHTKHLTLYTCDTLPTMYWTTATYQHYGWPRHNQTWQSQSYHDADSCVKEQVPVWTVLYWPSEVRCHKGKEVSDLVVDVLLQALNITVGELRQRFTEHVRWGVY